MPENDKAAAMVATHEKGQCANEDLVRKMERLQIILGQGKTGDELENALADVGSALLCCQRLAACATQDTTFDERRSYGPHGEAGGISSLFGDWQSDVGDWVVFLAHQERRTFPGAEEFFQSLAGDCAAQPNQMLHWREDGWRKKAPAARWVLAIAEHGKKAWGNEYTEIAVQETFEALLRARLLLTTVDFHRTVYRNQVKAVWERYAWEIAAFFDGRDRDAQANDEGRGHVWINRGGQHESLVVEPPTGDQFTVAVRFVNPEETGPIYHGYRASQDGLQGIGIEH